MTEPTRLDAMRALFANWRDDGYDCKRTTRPLVIEKPAPTIRLVEQESPR